MGTKMRRDAAAMLFWALRWHERRWITWQSLSDLLWGEFARKPEDAAGSIRELMIYVNNRYGDKWMIDDNGRGYRISPRPHLETARPQPTSLAMKRSSSGPARKEAVARRRRAAPENPSI